MARQPRIHYPEAVFHVYSRGNNKGLIFLDDQDYRAFLRLLKAAKGKLKFKLYAYALMPNHFHLVVRVAEAPVSDLMQRLLGGYARYFNRRYERVGHVFQGRFHLKHCTTDSYLTSLVRYIHLNPVRAGLSLDAEGWPWSGHRGYVRPGSDPLLDSGFVLGLLASDEAAAVQKYIEYVQGPSPRPDFLASASPVLAPVEIEAVEASLTLVRMADIAASKAGVSFQQVCGKSKVRILSDVRKNIIRRAVGAGFSNVELARFLHRSESVIARLADRPTNGKKGMA